MSVELRFLGHLGNNLFQYALGRVLAEELDLALHCVAPTGRPGFARVEDASGIRDRLWQLTEAFADVRLNLPGREIAAPEYRHITGEQLQWNGHGLNLGWLLRHGRDYRIVLRGYFQRSEYYLPYRERLRRWFAMRPAAGDPRPGPRDIVIHLRRSYDMRVLGRLLSLRFYEEILEGHAFERVYVCGLGVDAATRARLARFAPIYLDLDAAASLRLLTRASQIAIANSTFSWWGAWLSDATRIFFPRPARGYWSPERPEIALEVPEDRYTVVPDVALEDEPLFAIPPQVQLVAESSPRGGLLKIFAPGAQPVGLAVESALVPFAHWLAARKLPFDVTDFMTLDLERPIVPRAYALLEVLRQRRALDCDAGLLRAFLHTYGVG
ncbi:MAG TPA: hypothetical protein PJ986_19180 [Gammaproteobacteria bacterium]|nr:hypothetical protein [Gammaproteobacteria bacterium]